LFFCLCHIQQQLYSLIPFPFLFSPNEPLFEENKESDDSLLPTPQKLSFSFGSSLSTSQPQHGNAPLFNFASEAPVSAAANANGAVAGTWNG